MRFSYIALLGCAATASTAEKLASGKKYTLAARSELNARQFSECATVALPFTCEKSCGAGFASCVYERLCYNPSQGETCCSDGTYCPAGTYCTDAGCCPNELNLLECDASTALDVIPPPQQATNTPIPPPQPPTFGIPSNVATKASTGFPTQPLPTGTGTGIPQPITTGVIPTGGVPSGSAPSGSAPTGGFPGSSGNATVTTPGSAPPQQTVNAGVALNGAMSGVLLGFFGVFFAAL